MVQQPHPDDLAQLRARLDAQEAEIARLKRRRRLPRRFLPLALVGLLVALLPLSILAAGPVFSDLSTAAPVHQPNIPALGDAGITTGFEDPANPGQRTYNPKGLVTREEMASFLARTAGLGTNPPVANAKTAQTAATATDATQLGGQPASAYVRRAAADFGVPGSNLYTNGPLPKSFTVTTHGGTLLIFASGSAYGTAAGGLRVTLIVDGTPIGLLQVSVNETLSHKSLVPILISRTVPAGDHTVTFAVTGTPTITGTDGYDIYHLTVVELPLS